MIPKEHKEQRDERKKMASAFLEAAQPLKRTIALLSSGKVVMGIDHETEDEAKSRCGHDFCLGIIAFSALITELAIKTLHALELPGIGDGKVPCTHNVATLFSQLNADTRGKIEGLYDEVCSAYEPIAQQLGGLPIAGLREFWEWNQDAVTNFKYDPRPYGKIIPQGVLWDSPPTTMWDASSELPSFGKMLMDYAEDRVRKRDQRYG